MITAMLSFFGVIIGALLQYFFTRHLDRQRAHNEARTKAYTDYLRCVSEHANPDQGQSSDGHELAAKTADAKCRICLYGSSAVIEAFAQFELLGATINTLPQRSAFTRMVEIMRKDSTSGTDVKSGDLQVILLGASHS